MKAHKGKPEIRYWQNEGGVLRTDKILVEKKTSDANTITDLALTHKALSDVSCLVDFSKLEKLDLGFNNLSSLQGLNSCVNLKWLSVIDTKLDSLDGIQGLTKLTVLNAGKNKLRSMDEIKALGSLRAIILNDNEIFSICKLDQLQNLNTLVLSRNPVGDIGKSLSKVTSITKLSLSKCQIGAIGSSLKSCIELKELRLSHKDIKVISEELARNIKLQNLDLGNNLITNWSSLKVLSSLVNLRNLNLQGNPIAESDNLAKKIKKLLPNMQIFNARPTDQNFKNNKHERIIEIDDSSVTTVADKLKVGVNEKSKHNLKSDCKQGHLDNKPGFDEVEKLKAENQKTDKKAVEKEDLDSKRKSKKLKQGGEIDLIDDGETPFMELFDFDSKTENTNYSSKEKTRNKGFPNFNSGCTAVTKEKSKSKSKGPVAFELLSSTAEVGTTGPSTWDN